MKKILTVLFALVTLNFAMYGQINGFALQEDTSLYTENDKGEMIWKQTILWGEELKIDVADGKPLSKKAIRVSSGSKVERDFTSVSYNNSKFWVQSDRIAAEGQPGVVLEDAVLYLNLNSSKASRFVIPQGAIVAWKAIDSGNNEGYGLFTEVWWLEGVESYTTKHGYILSSKLSIFGGDVNAIQCLKKSASFTNDKAKQKYIDEAASKAVSESVKNLLFNGTGTSGATNSEELYNERAIGEVKGVYKVENLGGTLTTGIYSKPNKSSQLLMECNTGYEVYVIGRTKSLVTVDGKKNYWYYVSYEKGEGWIFGAWISDTGVEQF